LLAPQTSAHLPLIPKSMLLPFVVVVNVDRRGDVNVDA
jgi:hypothetical protein